MTSGRFLVVGDVAITAACVALAFLGQPIMLVFGCLTAACAYMLVNAGAWHRR